MTDQQDDPRLVTLSRWRPNPPALEVEPVDAPDGVVDRIVPFGFVIHQVTSVTGGRLVWAWCKAVEGKAGYDEITFTLADGTTPADPGPDPLRLGPVITRIWC